MFEGWQWSFAKLPRRSVLSISTETCTNLNRVLLIVNLRVLCADSTHRHALTRACIPRSTHTHALPLGLRTGAEGFSRLVYAVFKRNLITQID